MLTTPCTCLPIPSWTSGLTLSVQVGWILWVLVGWPFCVHTTGLTPRCTVQAGQHSMYMWAAHRVHVDQLFPEQVGWLLHVEVGQTFWVQMALPLCVLVSLLLSVPVEWLLCVRVGQPLCIEVDWPQDVQVGLPVGLLLYVKVCWPPCTPPSPQLKGGGQSSIRMWGGTHQFWSI